jgi:DNA-binding MarR family transcriptional regulator
MNKTAELVKLWADYEENHPDSGIDDFCRCFLIQQREKLSVQGFLGGIVPPATINSMAKLLGRIHKLHSVYAIAALKQCGITTIEEFLYLNSVANMPNPKKTVVIYSNFSELSSGLLVIERLVKRGYLKENVDKEDKRSKKLTITTKGLKVLKGCYTNMSLTDSIFFGEIPIDDLQLCLQLLKPIEIRFSASWQKDKGKSISELNTKYANIG